MPRCLCVYDCFYDLPFVYLQAYVFTWCVYYVHMFCLCSYRSECLYINFDLIFFSFLFWRPSVSSPLFSTHMSNEIKGRGFNSKKEIYRTTLFLFYIAFSCYIIHSADTYIYFYMWKIQDIYIKYILKLLSQIDVIFRHIKYEWQS